METELDLIESNTIEWKKVAHNFIKEVDKLLIVDAPKPEYKSLHCGIHKKHALVLKDGPYGFYIDYNGASISLQKFKSSEIINEWIINQEIPTIELKDLISYIEKKDGYVISSNISIRNGPKGYYIFYKTSKMKKPKFYNCDEIIELIENKDTDKISTYIEKKYNLL
jgi:DNA topoisomerase-1